jgi:hypothetical protein
MIRIYNIHSKGGVMNKKNPLEGMRVFVYLIVFGFILTTILVIAGIKRYNENLFDVSYKVNLQKLQEGLVMMTTNGVDYFYSPMYVDPNEVEKVDYEKTSGTFLQSYMGLRKYCGTSYDECFANKYKDERKKIYKPKFEGACAIIKNGTSICIIPQIGQDNITGIMDMNGKYGPNIFGKDLRNFEIPARKVYVKKSAQLSDVIEADY